MSLLAKLTQFKSIHRTFTRFFNVQSNFTTTNKFEHMSNMGTKDLFKFEPFSDSEYLVRM